MGKKGKGERREGSGRAVPSLCLRVHDQRDVAIDQGEGEELDAVQLGAGRSTILRTGGGNHRHDRLKI